MLAGLGLEVEACWLGGAGVEACWLVGLEVEACCWVGLEVEAPCSSESLSCSSPDPFLLNCLPAQRIRVRRQNMKVRINATGDTIVMKFVRPNPDTKLEGYILGYGSSMFSKQFIQLPENGEPYETEIDAEPKYLVAVQPIPSNDVKKQCTGKVYLEKPLHLVIGSVTPTSVLLSWGTFLKTPYEAGNIMNDCLEDGSRPSNPVNKKTNLVGKPGDMNIWFETWENSSLFSSLPASDVDALGKKRFVAPHVVYKTDKKPDEPCSITTSLSYFPEEEGGETNVTAPPKSPPSNLTVVTVEGCPSFIILDWEKTDNDTTEYEVISTTKGPDGTQVSILTTNQTHTAVENLKPESSYEFKVKPKNGCWKGHPSEAWSFNTDIEVRVDGTSTYCF
nr:target of Nesh-SH3-like [Salvelinus alpinus]